MIKNYVTPVGFSQYEGQNLDSVNARYITQGIVGDANNPLVAALPPRRPLERIIAQNTIGYMGNPNPQDASECLDAIEAIKSMRFPLSFQTDLYENIDKAMRRSYRDRNLRNIGSGLQIYVNNSETQSQEAISDGDVGGCSDAGLCVLGYSGTGKTSSLNTCLMDFPRLITHHGEDGSSFIQIPYIKVVCKNRYGMSALFDSFAEQIDYRLGNIWNRPYSKEMEKNKTVASKAQYACRLINILNIGMIVLDEIQNLDFQRSHKDSFSVWLGIVSETKVALCLVGTASAYTLFGNDYQMARRAGNIIDTMDYTKDIGFFNLVLNELTKYQFMSGYKLEMTPELRQAFYKETGGIIERVMYLWAQIQEDWINCPEDAKPVIDADYIIETTRIHQSSIQIGVHYLLENSKQETESITNLDTMATLMAVDDIAIKDRSWVHDKALEIVTNTTAGDHFTQKTIEKAVMHQEALKRNIGKKPEEIARLAIESLRKKVSDRRTEKPSD